MSDEKKVTPEIPDEDFSELIKEYGLKQIHTSTAVEGRIVDISTDRVVVDIGQKTEGVLAKSEILDWDGNPKYKVGDTITVIPVRWNTKEGHIEVSKKQWDEQEGWERVTNAFKKNTSVFGRITKLMPEDKGFIVDMGVEMFLPMSQANLTKVKIPQKLLGKEFWFKVTKINRKDSSGMVSRRVLQEEEKREKVQKVLGSLEIGKTYKGIVTSLQDYGAFVDMGGIEGLLHRENISYGRVNHPKEKLRQGDEIEVMVLDIDREKGKISLGLKQKFPDPWLTIDEKYPLGKRLVAKVTKIVSFGAFIELEDGVEGLLHISDLTWEGKPQTVEGYVAVGDKLWVQVIEVNKESRKIKLGLKQLEMRPEQKYMQTHRIGEVVTAKVKKILKSRVFLGISEEVEGVIKISDISYSRVESPEEFMREGEEIEAVIISDELDRNYKVQLGLKQLSQGQWEDFFAHHKPGNIIPIVLKKVTDNGLVAEITKHIEGFIRLSDIDEERLQGSQILEQFKVGDKKEAMILRFEPDKRKIYLSLRAALKQKEKEEIAKYMKSEDEPITTIGDLLQNELDKKK